MMFFVVFQFWYERNDFRVLIGEIVGPDKVVAPSCHISAANLALHLENIAAYRQFTLIFNTVAQQCFIPSLLLLTLCLHCYL